VEPYLIDSQTEFNNKPTCDDQMTTTSADIDSKPTRSSWSLPRHNEVKTTSDDVRTKPSRNNDSDMTTTSAEIDSRPARSSSSLPRHNDIRSVSADSNDITLPPPMSTAISRCKTSADMASGRANKSNEYSGVEKKCSSDMHQRSDVRSSGGLQTNTTHLEDLQSAGHDSVTSDLKVNCYNDQAVCYTL